MLHTWVGYKCIQLLHVVIQLLNEYIMTCSKIHNTFKSNIQLFDTSLVQTEHYVVRILFIHMLDQVCQNGLPFGSMIICFNVLTPHFNEYILLIQVIGLTSTTAIL